MFSSFWYLAAICTTNGYWNSTFWVPEWISSIHSLVGNLTDSHANQPNESGITRFSYFEWQIFLMHGGATLVTSTHGFIFHILEGFDNNKMGMNQGLNLSRALSWAYKCKIWPMLVLSGALNNSNFTCYVTKNHLIYQNDFYWNLSKSQNSSWEGILRNWRARSLTRLDIHSWMNGRPCPNFSWQPEQFQY